MPDVDVQSSVAGGTEEDQRKDGTHREHFSRLTDQFQKLVEYGAATPERYKQMCFTLLKSFEGVRLDQERQIKNFEAKIAYCRATQQNCSMFSNLLVGFMATQVQEAGRAEALGMPSPSEETGNGERISDTEMLRRICVCGCVDEEDAAQCECSCHSGKPCDLEHCVVCRAKKVQLASETSGRRRAPVPKRPKKKRSRKKAVPEKGSPSEE